MAQITSAELADAILRSATDGYYPDSELIATADLTQAHLPTILRALEAAKEDVKVRSFEGSTLAARHGAKC